MCDNKEFGTIDPRKEAFDKFKTAALADFESELDALTYGMVNEDGICIEFRIEVFNSATEDRYDCNMYRHSNKTLKLCNPKTVEDLEPVSEKEGE